MYYEALAAGAGGDWWHVIVLTAPLGSAVNVTDGDEDIDVTGTGNPMAIPVHNENSTYTITIDATGFQWTDQFNTSSVSGGYEFIDFDYGTIHLTFDDEFRGETLTITDNGSNTGTVTAPATGNTMDIFVPALGTWFISATISSKTYDCHTTITDYEVAKSVNLLMVPNGKTVTPTDDIQLWLQCAEIKDKPYTTLSEVMADEYTLRRVLTNDNANDYLKRSTTWIANPGKVPVMTDFTTPSGVVFENGHYASNNPYGWKAFDNTFGTFWQGPGNSFSSPDYVGYIFDNPTHIEKVMIEPGQWSTKSAAKDIEIQGSNDTTTGSDGTWTTLLAETLPDEPNTEMYRTLTYPGDYKAYRLVVKNAYEGTSALIRELQFFKYAESITESEVSMTAIGATDYGVETLMSDVTWKAGILASEYWDKVLPGLVPKMTSNTAPFGTAFAQSESPGDKAYIAFDGNDSTYNAGSSQLASGFYIGYRFEENDVSIKKALVNCAASAGTLTCRIEYLDDNDVWQPASATFQGHSSIGPVLVDINVDVESSSWRVYVISSTAATYNPFYTIQFYGIETGAVQSWLQAGNVVKPYITIEEVLADKNVLAKLMKSHEAVDYLVTAKGLIEPIINSELAMTYIGGSNYAANSLLADEEWRIAITNSDYQNKVLNISVPKMTANNAPKGTTLGSSNGIGANYNQYMAFNDDIRDGWLNDSTGNTIHNGNYIGYEFETPVEICMAGALFVWISSNTASVTGRFEAYDDDTSTWVPLTTTFSTVPNSNNIFNYMSINTNGKSYRKYRWYSTAEASTNSGYGLKIKFLGRSDIDESKVKVRGAHNASIYYKNNGVDVPLAVLTGTEGEANRADIELIPGYPGEVELYSTNTDDPDSIGNDFHKKLIVDANTIQIDVMPDETIYWYGFENPDKKLGGGIVGATQGGGVATKNDDNLYIYAMSMIIATADGNPRAQFQSNEFIDVEFATILNGIGKNSGAGAISLWTGGMGAANDYDAIAQYPTFWDSTKRYAFGHLIRLFDSPKKFYESINARSPYTVNTYAAWLTRHKANANFFGAANDTVYYMSGGAQVVFAETNNRGEAVVDFSQFENETLVLYSSVAKDPNNLSDDFSKVVTVDGNKIYFMPDGEVLYWYGYVGENCEVCSAANGWTCWSNLSFANPTFEGSDVDETGTASVVQAIGSKNKVSGLMRTIYNGVAIAGGQYGALAAYSSKVLTSASQLANVDLQTAGVNYDGRATEIYNGYPLIYSFNAGRQMKVNALWLAQHRQIANLFSAANDKVYYLDSGNNPVYVAETNEYGEAYVNWNYIPEGNVTLFSSVAKDPDNLSDPFSKQITNDGTLDKVYLMPDGDVLYWYGWMGSNCEDAINANGWSYSSGFTLKTPTHNLNDIYMTAVNQEMCGVGTKTKISGTVNAITLGSVFSDNSCGILSVENTKTFSITDYILMEDHAIKKYSMNANNNYIFVEVNNSRAMSLYALWVEP